MAPKKKTAPAKLKGAAKSKPIAKPKPSKRRAAVGVADAMTIETLIQTAALRAGESAAASISDHLYFSAVSSLVPGIRSEVRDAMEHAVKRVADYKNRLLEIVSAGRASSHRLASVSELRVFVGANGELQWTIAKVECEPAPGFVLRIKLDPPVTITASGPPESAASIDPETPSDEEILDSTDDLETKIETALGESGPIESEQAGELGAWEL